MTALDEMAAHYNGALEHDSPALSYLLGRGISRNAIDSFQLGAVDGSYPEHADFTGRISIPYLTKLGGVKGFKFRRVGDDESVTKYLANYMPTRIFNPLAFEAAESLGYIGISEGEFDAVINTAVIDIPTVAVPGVDTWKQHREWPSLFDGYDRVFIFKDNDEPGEKLARKIHADLDNAWVVSLPEKDLNLTYLKHGAGVIRNAAGID